MITLILVGMWAQFVGTSMKGIPMWNKSKEVEEFNII